METEPMNIPNNFKQLARVNTGSHFLDSGGTNGRHWQRPEISETADKVTANVYDGKIEYLSVETAIHLDEHLYIDVDATREFRAWCDQVDPQNNESPLALMERYAEETMPDANITSDNSYNWDSPYTQVFQFVAASYEDFIYDDEALVMVQMHNGADVRGGYTEAVIAKPNSGFSDGFVEMYGAGYEIQPYCNECHDEAESVWDAIEKFDWSSKVSDDGKTASLICSDGHEANEYAVN